MKASAKARELLSRSESGRELLDLQDNLIGQTIKWVYRGAESGTDVTKQYLVIQLENGQELRVGADLERQELYHRVCESDRDE